MHLTHFLFSSSTSPFPAPKCQVGIVIRSKRVSQPRKINVERSGTDLGTRTTLSDKFCSFLCRVTWGITLLSKPCPERREMVVFYRTDSKDRHNSGEGALQRACDALRFCLTVIVINLYLAACGTNLSLVLKPGSTITRNSSAPAAVGAQERAQQRQISFLSLQRHLSKTNGALVLPLASWVQG